MTINEAILHDFDPTSEALIGRPAPEAVAQSIFAACKPLQIVYTAFDGDLFQLCGHMRHYVLDCGAVPANPESILGYRDTVMAHLDKAEVLRDDLSVLNGCDELWVFTEASADPAAVAHLAEGVIVELLYFLSSRQQPLVKFVSPLGLLRSERPAQRPYTASYEETIAYLPKVGRGAAIDFIPALRCAPLRPLAYFITDPLDFKYAAWLRAGAYTEALTPLVPGLAIEMRDVSAANPRELLPRTLTLWAKLCKLAALGFLLPPMEPERPPSFVSIVLQRVWQLQHGENSLIRRAWQDYPIPKARSRAKWALTHAEQRGRNGENR